MQQVSLTIEMLKVFGPVVGAVLGGFAGAQFALRKHRRERAFDRRIEWYERTLSVLWQQHLVLEDEARAGKEFTSSGDCTAHWSAVLDRVAVAIGECHAQAAVYADSASIEALDKAREDILGIYSRPSHSTAVKDIAAWYNLMAWTYSQTLAGAHGVLSESGRRHLGFERVERS